ncbi:MAG: ABC transporter substrate-binding protein, partial [Thauera sp.]|nr:ABC transporter substrate-binding protein [Thauera sp.]
VAAFRQKYAGRYPSVYAAMAYDTLMAMDAAVRDVGGKIEDREAVLKALKNPSFKSLRGEFQYGANNFPVQNYYLREVGKDAEGRITNKLVGTTLEKHQDAYVGACKM